MYVCVCVCWHVCIGLPFTPCLPCNIPLCLYVCIYVFMHVLAYHSRQHVASIACLSVFLVVCLLYVCIYVFMYSCMYWLTIHAMFPCDINVASKAEKHAIGLWKIDLGACFGVKKRQLAGPENKYGRWEDHSQLCILVCWFFGIWLVCDKSAKMAHSVLKCSKKDYLSLYL